MDVIEQLVRNVVVTSYENIPSEAIEMEKANVLDIIGCLVAGAAAPGCSAVMELAREMGGKEESTIMMYGGKVPAQTAALVNATMARAIDFEAHSAGPSHASAPTVATAFAIGEKLGGVSGKDFLTALSVGIDLTTRLYHSCNIARYGWDPALVCAIFGATAVAGKLLGLEESQMVHAFGIALNQAAGTYQGNYDGALTVRLNTGLAARDGIFSALLAQRGITGVKQVMQGKWGFYHLYARDEYDPEVLIDELGERFRDVETPFKTYPSCYATHMVTEATIELARKHDIKPDDVAEIIVGVAIGASDSFVGRPFKMGENLQVDAQFSIQYTAANALLRRDSLKEHFTDEFITDPQVQELVNKVKQVEVRQSHAYGRALSPLRVEIRMKDGKSYSTQCVSPRGSLERPLSKEEIVEKFRDSIRYSAKTSKALPVEKVEKILALVDHLEGLDNVNQIVELVIA
ncbi:MmgE/PrpD family protein [Chloroflexota bacterium]